MRCHRVVVRELHYSKVINLQNATKFKETKTLLSLSSARLHMLKMPVKDWKMYSSVSYDEEHNYRLVGEMMEAGERL